MTSSKQTKTMESRSPLSNRQRSGSKPRQSRSRERSTARHMAKEEAEDDNKEDEGHNREERK